MIIKQKIRFFKRDISNLVGWRTRKKYLILESDDWGSIRVPSKVAYDQLSKENIDLQSHYNKFDSLASKDDLEILLDTLFNIKDSNNTALKLSAMSLVANPDFKSIRDSNFKEYHYESFVESLERYPECSGSFKLWQEGERKNIFLPEFHGREHVNTSLWLNYLQLNDRNTRLAFDYGFWGLPPLGSKDSFQAAFDISATNDGKEKIEILSDGLKLFEKIHKRKASVFVPPNGPLNSGAESTCRNLGIKYISVPKLRKEPLGNYKYKIRPHYLGQKSKDNIYYLTRNCFFEPTHFGENAIDMCLSEISSSFKLQKPAVISSHRVNYIGRISESNRDRGVRALQSLMQAALKKWPDIEFLSSKELGDIISSKKQDNG